MPQSAENVEFNWINSKNLDGITGLEGMQKIEIHRSRNLTTLRGLERWSDTLNTIVINACKNLSDISVLDKLSNLKRVYINDKEYI